MKKISVMIAAAAVAVGSMAEIINWNGAFPVVGGAENNFVQMYASTVELTDTWYENVFFDHTGSIDAMSDSTVFDNSMALADVTTALNASLRPTSVANVTVPGVVSDGADYWLYTVVFDAATTAEAQNFKVLDTVVYKVSASSGVGGTPVGTYTIGLTSSGNTGEWTAVVPEPATLGLMAVSGLGLFFARKKKLS